MSALHQMRISQVPLRPSEQGNIGPHNQPPVPAFPEQDPTPDEKLSSLDHVRYNIVCEWSSLS